MPIKKEVIIGDCRLLLGDCLGILPLLDNVDAMVTDPPYGIGDIMVGSGHFAGLCKKMGRKFIGIELDEDYFNIACKRIQAAYNEPDMFIELAKKPEQVVLEL